MHPVVEKALSEGRAWLSLSESLRLLEDNGIPVARYVTLSGPEDAERAAKLGFPLVLKIDSPDVLHKSDVGGVRVGIRSLEELRRAAREILDSVKAAVPGARIYGLVAQEMLSEGYELFIGGINDRQFGPVVAFGLGGVFVEVLRDVAFDLAPLTPEEARRLIEQPRGARLLHGYRGRPPANLDLLARVVSRFSELIYGLDGVFEEADLNPTYAWRDWVKVVDARFKLRVGGTAGSR